MPIELIGDQCIAQEIVFKIKQWDDAIAKLDFTSISQLCAANVHVFDISQQIEGIAAFQALWECYRIYFVQNIRVYRRRMTIFAQPHLAFMYCDSKIDHVNVQQSLHLPWCRTTLCFQKQQAFWKIVHQHISLAQPW